MKTIYVSRRLTGNLVAALQHLALERNLEPDLSPHVTLIWSEERVDHRDRAFAMDPEPLRIPLINPQFAIFGNNVALAFDAPQLAQRHKTLRDAGAVSNWPDFQPHISIGKFPATTADPAAFLPAVDDLDLPHWLEFGAEVMRLIGRDYVHTDATITEAGYCLGNVATFRATAEEALVRWFEISAPDCAEFVLWRPGSSLAPWLKSSHSLAHLTAEAATIVAAERAYRANPEPTGM